MTARIAPEIAERIFSRYQEVHSISAVAREFGVSRPTVAACIDRHDADARSDNLCGFEGGALVTNVSWLLLPPARLRVQLEVEGR